jgi:hypothetical protein
MIKNCWMLFAAALLCACPPPVTCDPDVDDCTDGGSSAPADVCNSIEEALTLPQCELLIPPAPDAGFGYITTGADGGIDQDFYLVKLPALTGRSLVHVTVGYGAPATPVNLAVSILKEDGTSAGVTRKIDRHGSGAPKPVELIFPYAVSNSKLIVMVADENATNKPLIDVRSPYQVKVEVLNNPDANEPNDTDALATPIALAAGGPGIVGQGLGAIATDDDVDKFTFVAPAGRKILYLHLTGACLTPGAAVCDTRLMPPPPFRLSYVLLDSTNTQVAEGQAPNEYAPVDLATAKLTTAGKYTVVVQGYKPPGMTATLTPGDLRTLYKLDVQLMDDLDLNEPNDSVGAPKVISLAPGASSSSTGRIAYVPDPDVFAIDLGASGSSGVLRYKLTLSGTAGRFAPLFPSSDRQLRLVTEVTAGATLADRRTACVADAKVCPKGYENAQTKGLVDGLCMKDPPLCLWSDRNEDSAFANLKNMEGVIPVAAHGATARYLLFVQDDGNNYADDREYTLAVSYEADPDETTRSALPSQTQSATLAENDTGYPVPVTTGEISGVLSHGYGRTLVNRIDQGEGIRAPNDYDAVPTDSDRFDFSFPTGTGDRTWALQWEIQNGAGGKPPGDLALEVDFCTGPNGADGGCPGSKKIVAAYEGRIELWYDRAFPSRQISFTKAVVGNKTVVTVEPIACYCIEPRFTPAGHMAFNVLAVDRNSNEPITYKVRQSTTNYPKSFGLDGGISACPVVTDGGASCRFTIQ